MLVSRRPLEPGVAGYSGAYAFTMDIRFRERRDFLGRIGARHMAALLFRTRPGG